MSFILNMTAHVTFITYHCTQVADYELLLRRVMRRAPNAALMSFSIFSFDTESVAPKAAGSVPGGGQQGLSYDLPFYDSGGSKYYL
jgi:hypothetical protein